MEQRSQELHLARRAVHAIGPPIWLGRASPLRPRPAKESNLVACAGVLPDPA